MIILIVLFYTIVIPIIIYPFKKYHIYITIAFFIYPPYYIIIHAMPVLSI